MIVYPSDESSSLMDDALEHLDSDYYNTDYSKAEIRAYLKRVKDCIRAGRFIVLDDEGGTRLGRKKNSDFMARYGLYARESQASLLMSIDVDDFCHSVRSSDGRNLYVFCVRRPLYKAGSGTCEVWIYIKHDCPEGNEVTDVVVSMHELEQPIRLVFVD